MGATRVVRGRRVRQGGTLPGREHAADARTHPPKGQAPIVSGCAIEVPPRVISPVDDAAGCGRGPYLKRPAVKRSQVFDGQVQDRQG